MSGANWQATLLVADDLREETTRKEILIGLYGDAIVTGGLPALMPSAVFVFIVQGSFPAIPREVVVRLEIPGESGTPISVSTNDIERLFGPGGKVEGDWVNVRLNIKNSPFVLKSSGIAQAWIAIDGEQRLAGKFRIDSAPMQTTTPQYGD